MRVVVVDPSRTVLKFVQRMLEAGDHEVRPFVDGESALAYVKSDPQAGALITSAELSPMSGLELCWETRLLASGQRPIYILLMSSNHDRHTLVEALDGGADDFIGKPPIPEELHARLRAAGRLASMQYDLIRLASTDPLTGVLNRRAFFERAEEMCVRAKAGDPVCAIMLDIDHFKRVNDSFGHVAGDETICGVARSASATGAVVGRLGGEEFAMLLPGHDLAAATAVAEDLRRTLAAQEFASGGRAIKLTCSFGVSEWGNGEQIDQILMRADVALYAAKSEGRNRVVVASAALSSPASESSTHSIRLDARVERAVHAGPRARAAAGR